MLNLNLANILILLGVVQGIFLGLMLLIAPNFRKKANQFLAILLFAFSLNNLWYWAIDTQLVHAYPIIYGLPLTYILLIPASLYLYISFLYRENYTLQKRDYGILIPAVLDTGHELCYKLYFLFTGQLHTGLKAYASAIYYPREMLAIVYSLIVFGFIFYTFRQYREELLQQFSQQLEEKILWLRRLIWIAFGLWVLWSVPFLVETSLEQAYTLFHYPLWISMSVAIYWIGIVGMRKKEVFEIIPLLPDPPEKTGLSGTTDVYFERAVFLMEEKALYRRPLLSLQELADELSISPNYLSQIINNKAQQNFFEFVNTYRVEEVKRNLLHPDYAHYDILSIGLESGFNSKSAFYSTFKKLTGQTPARFRKANS